MGLQRHAGTFLEAAGLYEGQDYRWDPDVPSRLVFVRYISYKLAHLVESLLLSSGDFNPVLNMAGWYDLPHGWVDFLPMNDPLYVQNIRDDLADLKEWNR